MAEQRMVPVELLERILSITQPIAPAISAEIRAMISGPSTAQPSAVVCPEEVYWSDLRLAAYATDKEK